MKKVLLIVAVVLLTITLVACANLPKYTICKDRDAEGKIGGAAGNLYRTVYSEECNSAEDAIAIAEKVKYRNTDAEQWIFFYTSQSDLEHGAPRQAFEVIFVDGEFDHARDLRGDASIWID